MRAVANALEPGTLYLVASLRDCHQYTPLASDPGPPAIFRRNPAWLDNPSDPACAALLGEAICERRGWGLALYYHEAQSITLDVAGTLFYLVNKKGDGHTGYRPPPKAPGVPDCTISFDNLDSSDSDSTDGDDGTPKIIPPIDGRFDWHVRRLAHSPCQAKETIGLARLLRVPHCLIKNIHEFLHWATRTNASAITSNRFEWAVFVAYHLRSHIKITQNHARPQDLWLSDEGISSMTLSVGRDMLPWIAGICTDTGVLPRPILITAFSVGLRWEEVFEAERTKAEAKCQIANRQRDAEAAFQRKYVRRVMQRRARLWALANRAVVVSGGDGVSDKRVRRERALRDAEEEALLQDEADLRGARDISTESLARLATPVEMRWKSGAICWEQCTHWYGGQCSDKVRQALMERSILPRYPAANAQQGERRG